ncbi:hypothetical protein [Rothia halotolerans]|uniref:hypothetical protein n=1 Tax=Rothia halotolerans TaxID=405770 RepID=UPI00101C5B45|nr:hypothetical protein [Rothia halotolerans]
MVKDETTPIQSEDEDEGDTGTKKGVDIPIESAELQRAYKQSGLTAADLAAATGISVGAVRIALAGIRYYKGEPRTTHPPDETLAKLASVLGIDANMLRGFGRERAAAIMADVETAAVDLQAPAAIAGRQALAKQVLGVFSTDELEAEVKRRRMAERED